jgi:hypothetical protein
MMIAEHTFNSAWYGAPSGIVRDLPALAAAGDDEVHAALARFAFVELRCAPDAPGADRPRLARLGFFLADTQILFRLGLAALRPTPSLDALTLHWADDAPFTVDAMAPFRHERFQHLPGMTAARIDARYARWAADLVAASPATCLRVASAGVTQGWFLSERRGPRLRLALAMAAAGATISGLHLYLAACLGYAARGHTVGEASFSVHNTAVLNIYAHLGARFVATEDHWLWIAPGTRA